MTHGRSPLPLVRIDLSPNSPHDRTERPFFPSHPHARVSWLADTWHLVWTHRWVKWIPPKLTWKGLRPVLRCALAAWLGFLVQLIRPSERALGYAAFFVLVVAFMVPPAQPVVQNFEVLLNLYFFTGLAWAWLAIGVFAAGRVRSPIDPSKLAKAEAKWSYLRGDPASFNLHLIYDATYLEAKSCVVCAVFLAIGTGALLWYKLRTQPSPATFPLVLSCILLDIGLTTAALYPYPNYSAGLLFFLPMAVQGGIAILCSLLVFPESVAHSFQAKLEGVLSPLQTALESIELLFRTVPLDAAILDSDRLEAWATSSESIKKQLLASLSGVAPLRAQQRYLKVDISYGRLSGRDLRDVFDQIATLQTRSGGMAFFFDVIVTTARHLHLDSSAFSVHHPPQSRPGSRPASVRESLDGAANDESDSDADDPEVNTRRFHLPTFLHRRSGSPHANGQKGSHISLLDHLRKLQQPVGLYESQRYMDVERSFSNDTVHVLEQLEILAEAGQPLIHACCSGLAQSKSWLNACNKRRLPRIWSARIHGDQSLDETTSRLQSALDDFLVSRLAVVQPYRHLFDPAHPPHEAANYHKLHYRGLFHVFVAQYHMIEFAEALLRLLRTLEDYELNQATPQLWYPVPASFFHHLRASHQDPHLTDGDDGNENDAAFERDQEGDELGEVTKRDPEYTPFNSPILNALSGLARIPGILRSRSFLYAVKAGILTTLTTLPQFISSSAAFYYNNRGIWCAIMAQLTLAVFSGDTTTAWLARCVASFWGCLFGMIIWYMGSGSSSGNAFGLAAVTTVAFPLAMFFRVHFPGPVLTAVMLPVTMGVVLGYSYLNASFAQLTSATWGFDVAWRRFLCVVIGITAAWFANYIPPVYSGKRAIRQSYAGVISSAGSILCEIISHANESRLVISEQEETRSKLLTWRSKLNKLGLRHNSARLEYSLRGRWPEERYQALLETLQDLLSLLAQLNHVLTQLERPWRRALLERTRLCDPTFLGDVSSVIGLCSTALRSAKPLPQITPSPLVARFRQGKFRGLDLPHDPVNRSEIPILVTVEVLESDHYMRYALGVTTTYSILSRLDRTVVICKTLLGENYHISGLHLEGTVAGHVPAS